MRIIAGEFRGRKLISPVGESTRPVTDRAKQSVFDVLSQRIDGAVVYDGFAGTGSFGLECLSRGAASVTFIELNRSALDRLRENIEILHVADRSIVISDDIFSWIKSASPPPKKADLIFLDPPYQITQRRPRELIDLARHLVVSHLSPDGMVIFRHHANDVVKLPGLLVENSRQFAAMSVEFLIRK
jgi:16S rRNA (guanine966-N2)-methyltransferase